MVVREWLRGNGCARICVPIIITTDSVDIASLSVGGQNRCARVVVREFRRRTGVIAAVGWCR